MNPPVHELHPPIQRGWKRHFVLTHAVHKRPDAVAFETILTALNTTQHFWRPNFRYSRRQSARRKVVSIEQPLAALHREELEQEPIVAGWRKYFRLELVPRDSVRRRGRSSDTGRWTVRCFDGRNQSPVWAYVFRFPHLFDLRVEKHWLTHCAEIEPEVMNRIAEIER